MLVKWTPSFGLALQIGQKYGQELIENIFFEQATLTLRIRYFRVVILLQLR
jgi:hypothetical protein